MKIIKSGTKTPPDKQVYVIKCRTCGCVFTYEGKGRQQRGVRFRFEYFVYNHHRSRRSYSSMFVLFACGNRNADFYG